MYSATLDCGAVLRYEARTFVPRPGERVPCLRHGYCAVVARGGQQSGAARRGNGTRPRARTQEELIAWLRTRSAATVHVLRKHRFSLRMITSAERDGLVVVDVETGRVVAR